MSRPTIEATDSTRSNFVARMPQRRAARVASGTPRLAENFRRILRQIPARALPFVNPHAKGRGQRARAERVTIDDGVLAVRHSGSVRAVQLVQAFVADAGKENEIVVELAPSQIHTPADPHDLLSDFALTSARFITRADEAIHHRYGKHSIQKELQREAIGLAARLRLLRSLDRDDS